LVEGKRFSELTMKAMGSEADESVRDEWLLGSGTTARPSS
jgi:hypothetical protein